MICYSDWILSFRLMQNQRSSQTTLSLAPAGWGIHTYVCQHCRAHPWGIPPSRGKWLYHLCHPSGSEADTANPLHVFNVAHVKPWSHANIPQASPTDVPAAAAAAAGSVLTPGWTSSQLASTALTALLQHLQVLLTEMSLPLPGKAELPAPCSTFPSPAEQTAACQEGCSGTLGSHWTGWVGCIV